MGMTKRGPNLGSKRGVWFADNVITKQALVVALGTLAAGLLGTALCAAESAGGNADEQTTSQEAQGARRSDHTVTPHLARDGVEQIQGRPQRCGGDSRRPLGLARLGQPGLGGAAQIARTIGALPAMPPASRTSKAWATSKWRRARLSGSASRGESAAAWNCARLPRLTILATTCGGSKSLGPSHGM